MSYGEITAIRVWGTGVDRSYGIDRSRAVDPGEFWVDSPAMPQRTRTGGSRATPRSRTDT
jgi:hypothetical protein